MTQGEMAYRIADDWGLKVFPVIPQGKRPMSAGWGEAATTDPLTISKTWAKTPNANIGIPTGQTNGIVVVDLDGDEAIAWFEGLGILLGAEVHTPSGGKHYYYAIEPDVEIKTSVSEVHRGVDVRAEGGLVVGPGSVIAGKIYRGDLGYIPDAPQELLDLLPLRQHFSNDPIPDDAEPVEAASEQEARELAWIGKELDALERPWREGAGWRSAVFGHACWLWRMVRSPHYAVDEAGATTLLLTHAPTDDRWTDSNVLAEWEDAKKRTVGQYAQPPLETRPPLEPWDGFPLSDALPMVGGEPYFKVWNSKPAKEGAGAAWAHRQKLLVGALKAGYTEAKAATLVWNSAAAKGVTITFGGETHDDEDGRAITLKELWREVEQAAAEVAKTQGEAVEVAPVEERPALTPGERPTFLDAAEREALRAPEAEWWGVRYLNWATETFSTVNLPYYRMNRWTVLSVVFGHRAVLPRPGGNDRTLTLYQAIVGPTTSGKSEALRPLKKIFNYFYMAQDSTPHIGGDFTGAALTKLLIERDGKPSWFQQDEAHTKIHEWKKTTGPYSDMPGLITELYDGEVGPRHRSTEQGSGMGAKAFLTVHLMGTKEGMAAVMGPQDWESGFLNRFVWAIGEPAQTDAASLAGDWISEETLGDEEEVNTGERMYQQWAAEFAEAAQRVTRADGKPMRLQLPQAVIDRHRRFAEDLYGHARGSHYEERLRPTFRRLNESTLRCAGLIALSEGRLRVTMTDLLIAIEQTEEWAENILEMVKITDQTVRTREVNMIERHLVDKGGEATISSIHRIPILSNRSREVDGLIGELVAQGRAARSMKEVGGVTIEVLKAKGVAGHGFTA